ncbi:DUF2520 domain-containing protein [Flavobacteriaceae bacterium AU392]|nr:DUF2520 domain-containing protein [Flavobacteriaceae bacterium]RKM86488.1 DUF2520 domain-containing protein [Flavobacteriaceae bacterium AU392]
MINTVIIGAGNVATHLFNAFYNAKNISVSQWYARNLNDIQVFSNKTAITDKLSDLNDADIYIIAVSDDAIASLSSKLPFSNKLIAHTSGSVGLPDLNNKNHRSVFYPLQTFSKTAEIDFSEVPICIEIERKADLNLLKTLANEIGSPFYKVNSEQRSALHLAAVFVNNFSNQLYRIGHEITEASNVEFDILKPLIKETARKIEGLSPFMAQTGPAKRNDKKTIQKHLSALTNKKHKAVYELMTKSIQDTYGKKL